MASPTRRADFFRARAAFSKGRLDGLGAKFESASEFRPFPKLTVFAAGSYGRLEASEHSDIDLFFFWEGKEKDLRASKINSIQMYARVIQIVDHMSFPKLSNDGQYLEIHHTDGIVSNLGGRHDDYLNHFTARMLFLLESKPVHNSKRFDSILETIIESYYRDYPDHPMTFRPIFLVNDIIRFWKTLCLNYEHKRNQPTHNAKQKLKQKVKNFKLKYSRMMTCFATVAILSAYDEPVKKEQVIEIANITPRERLQRVADILPSTQKQVEAVIREYAWFLEMTQLTEKALHEHFFDKENRTKAFERANRFGSLMFELLRATDLETGNMRYLVI